MQVEAYTGQQNFNGHDYFIPFTACECVFFLPRGLIVSEMLVRNIFKLITQFLVRLLRLLSKMAKEENWILFFL